MKLPEIFQLRHLAGLPLNTFTYCPHNAPGTLPHQRHKKWNHKEYVWLYRQSSLHRNICTILWHCKNALIILESRKKGGTFRDKNIKIIFVLYKCYKRKKNIKLAKKIGKHTFKLYIHTQQSTRYIVGIVKWNIAWVHTYALALWLIFCLIVLLFSSLIG